MRMVIPEYRGRVSPVFDTCQKILVFQMSDGSTLRPLGSGDWSYLALPLRANRLHQMGIDVILYGVISAWLARQIEALGIRLIPWLAGNVQQVLDAFVTGSPPDRRLSMPGSWSEGHGRRFRRRGER